MEGDLSAGEMVRLWEQCAPLHPIDRGLTLLAALRPERSYRQWAALSIGRRDARLLALRRKIMGPHLDGRSNCPGCGDPVEFHVNCEDLLADAPPEPPPEVLTITCQGYRVRARVLTSLDLAAAVGCPDAAAARETLLAHAVLSASHADGPVDAAGLPRTVQAVVNAEMAKADPLGEIRMAFDCPACGHRWRENLDVIAFFWEELTDRVRRIFRQVHVLARAYGWTEADILALSDRRRNVYLQMVCA